MNQVENFSFSIWILIESTDRTLIQENRGYLQGGKPINTIGFFHVIDSSQSQEQVNLIKPTLTWEEFKDKKVGKNIFCADYKTFINCAKVLAEYKLCNN